MSELDYAKQYLKKYKLLKKENFDRRFLVIDLLSAVEELTKHIYMTLLRKCLLGVLSEELNRNIYGIDRKMKDISEDINKLYTEHLFKYTLFTQIAYYVAQVRSTQSPCVSHILENQDPENVVGYAKKIHQIRNTYLTYRGIPIDESDLLTLTNKLEECVEEVINNISIFDNISKDSCNQIFMIWLSSLRHKIK
ncbi:hypothetical protein L3N51_01387 [Metallosphaera sp. J1]|uniref:hypothetical protein n=1 Tax=Metallosphaera javensis (ex Hofmann et al. 2022) TaxID=99938 RepID=UPI001EE0CD41|nr:hypothetical protein [Metallosphaera javensis (ex Hofmann et al. 2022)]MCG3109097.1 hypothetical protein [Metallosphaera javensis (ex Hofmann et al. 2022)]